MPVSLLRLLHYNYFDSMNFLPWEFSLNWFIFFLAFLSISVVSLLVFALVIYFKISSFSKSLKIFLEAEDETGEAILKQLDIRMEEGVNQVLEEYKKMLFESVVKLSAGLTKNASSEILSFSQFIEGQKGEVKKSLEEQIGTLITKALQELENYKQGRMSSFEGEVKDLAHRTALEILGRSISVEEHEQLIWEALDKAKRGGIFKSTSK